MITTASDSRADRAPKRYKYATYPKLAGFIIGPLLATFFLGMGIVLFRTSHPYSGVAFVLLGVFFAAIAAIGFSTYSPIIVSDDGIAACKFGWTMTSIRWQEVKKIRKMRLWNMGARAYQDRYYVYDREYGVRRMLFVNLGGPIVFTDEIRGLRELLDKVNAYARQYRFSLVVLDQEAAGKLAAQKGAEYLKRAAPKTNEVEVATF